MSSSSEQRHAPGVRLDLRHSALPARSVSRSRGYVEEVGFFHLLRLPPNPGESISRRVSEKLHFPISLFHFLARAERYTLNPTL
jgi:hypothetical protein